MPAESLAHPAKPVSLPASGWSSWAPEVAEAAEPAAGVADEAPAVDRLGAFLTLLMWGCTSLLAVWYL